MTTPIRIPGTARMSSAVIYNGVAYFKGVTARGGPASIAGQTANVLDQIDALLKQAGTSKERLLKVTIWLSDIANFGPMNEVYDRWVAPGSQPVRACVESRLAAPELLVEMQVEAAV